MSSFILSFVPINSNTWGQNWLVKMGSLSEMIDRGTPCKRMIMEQKISATWLAVCDIGNGPQCVYFVSLSITNKITVYSFDLGSPMMKSRAISSQIFLGVWVGCTNPYFLGRIYSCLTYIAFRHKFFHYISHLHPIQIRGHAYICVFDTIMTSRGWIMELLHH